jgi:hypothetical protein
MRNNDFHLYAAWSQHVTESSMEAHYFKALPQAFCSRETSLATVHVRKFQAAHTGVLRSTSVEDRSLGHELVSTSIPQSGQLIGHVYQAILTTRSELVYLIRDAGAAAFATQKLRLRAIVC